MDILLASSNPGKIQELTALLVPLGVRLHTIEEFPDVVDFSENEPTFEANATGKAQWFVEQTGLPTLADDGGLEIDALAGWPGVHSRRIFGDGRRGTDEDLINEVLRRMHDLKADQRGCQMRTVVAFAAPDGTTFSADGVDRGAIVEHPSPKRIPGFPFRSIFYHPKSSTIVVDASTDPMTHRHDAVAKILPKILAWAQSA